MVSLNPKDTRVLLIGQDPADARVVREALAEATHDSFSLECVTSLSDGLERLTGEGSPSSCSICACPTARV